MYQVGDKVWIRSDIDNKTLKFGVNITDEMISYKNQSFTVAVVSGGLEKFYQLMDSQCNILGEGKNWGGSGWYWTDECFSDLEPLKEFIRSQYGS